MTLSRRAKGVLALVVGLLFLLAAGGLLERAYRIQSGRQVEGRVLSVDAEAGTIVVRYPGITASQERTFDHPDPSSLRRGRRQGVVVISDERAYLQGDTPSAFPIVLLALLATACVGGGVLAIVRPH